MVAQVVRRILAPVEIADNRDLDVGYAISLAAQLRAELLLLAVIDTPTTVDLIGRHRAIASSSADFDKALQDEVKAMLQRLVDQADAAGVKAVGHLTVSEDVEEQILKEALVQRVDLILVQSRGRNGIMQALLGSTAGELLKAAPCPVLVARV